MKALMLASGMGSRLGSRNGPKPLVHVSGVALIERTILTARLAGIHSFIVVTGHRGDDVDDFLHDLSERRQVPITCVRNERFDQGNGLSVLAGRHLLDDEPFVVLMADHVLDKGLIVDLIAGGPFTGGVVAAVDTDVAGNHGIDLDDVTRVATEGGAVVRIGKGIDRFDGYDTGAFLCTPAVFDAIDTAAAAGDSSFSAGLQVLANRGLLRAHPIAGHRWLDIDTPADHRRATRRLYGGDGKARDGAVATVVNRRISQRVVTPLLLRTWPGVTPNAVTVLSFVTGVLAAAALLAGHPLAGALLIQGASVLDGSDGEIARLQFAASRYGGFLDAVLDRAADGAIFLGVLGFLLASADVHALLGSHTATVIVTVVGIALVAHLLVSYTSAKAVADLGHDYTGRLIGAGKGRDVRLFVVAIAAVIAAWWSPALLLAMAFIAVFTISTVVERLRRSWIVECHPWALVDAVVVDFDGTVVASMGALADLAVELLVSEIGLAPDAARRLYLRSAGLDFASQLEEVAPGHLSHASIAATFEAAKRDLLSACQPFPDLAPFLDELDRAGISVTICSSSRREIVEEWCDANAVTPRVRAIDGFTPGRPKTTQIADAVARLGVRPSSVLFVGDTVRDADLARSCGVRFRGVHREVTASTFVGSGVPCADDLAAIGRTVRRVSALGVRVRGDEIVPARALPWPEVTGVVRAQQPRPVLAVAQANGGDRAVRDIDRGVAGGPGADRPRHRGAHDRIVREGDDRPHL